MAEPMAESDVEEILQKAAHAVLQDTASHKTIIKG